MTRPCDWNRERMLEDSGSARPGPNPAADSAESWIARSLDRPIASSHNRSMLTAATLGLAAYGVYSASLGAVDFFRSPGLDWWADVALIVLGLLLLLAAAFVRVRLPGGLALALGALLALQALSLHNDMHFY